MVTEPIFQKGLRPRRAKWPRSHSGLEVESRAGDPIHSRWENGGSDRGRGGADQWVWTRAQQEACSVTLLGTSGTLGPCGWEELAPGAGRKGSGGTATGPSPASPPKDSISVVLGQHFFNRTTDVTQTFGIEKYIPYPLYSVFNPSDHDLGEAQDAAGAAG